MIRCFEEMRPLRRCRRRSRTATLPLKRSKISNVYSAKDQAKILFRDAVAMVDQSPALDSRSITAAAEANKPSAIPPSRRSRRQSGNSALKFFFSYGIRDVPLQHFERMKRGFFRPNVPPVYCSG
ncbi:MAG: hypothetical protein A3J28_17210 [Acidobacteria bacterium RIFCSPLOWO2_12_FULL_60_22]|nr:MAG: hypothetical protein A3J28_17210 [Acidobacteria bacterium RIFCSPLOWO2_12_FULL_60_22]